MSTISEDTMQLQREKEENKLSESFGIQMC